MSPRRSVAHAGTTATPAAPPELTVAEAQHALLAEISWEVCQQSGGIYTVMRSKAPSMLERWGKHYCLVGPYDPQKSPGEFEEAPLEGPFGAVVRALRDLGFRAFYGLWLCKGRPPVVLLDPASVAGKLHEIKYYHWRHHEIGFPAHDKLLDAIACFGYLVTEFLRLLHAQRGKDFRIVAQFHEWMAATAIPELRRQQVPVAMVFTTHATLLGRYLAMHDPWFYDHVPFFDWAHEARHFNIETQVRIERAAAHGAHIFTTVSRITAFECTHLLGRTPEFLVPNGINIEHFAAMHEFQNLHRMYKEEIHQFTRGHFFPSYAFDLDKTLYFFTSGRCEFRNKGFDLAIDALARLNHRMKAVHSPATVVFFLITKMPYHSINPEVMESRAVMEEMRHTCEMLATKLGPRLLAAITEHKLPHLDELADDVLLLRLRRMMFRWHHQRLPPIVTHDLHDDQHDEVLNKLRACQLFNRPDDPVKVVYHPDFVTPSDPLFGMDYDQFVRGCHLGVFPSAYEPWGYTPLECIASGIPSITSDLAGFGTFVTETIGDYHAQGLRVIKRRNQTFDQAADELTTYMMELVQMDRRDRIAFRNQIEGHAERFDWTRLVTSYFCAQHAACALAFAPAKAFPPTLPAAPRSPAASAPNG